ncbi:MAG: hypothetical protein IT578_12105 [Verrucomicrobiae bacterium]|nr:hypothetical protein [Verrucomicrobiae bacterium]
MHLLNLFHEQQRIQRERDLDPVRLTILGGLVVAIVILLYAGVLYTRMGGLRVELEARRKGLAQLDAQIKTLGPLTDLARIQGQAQLLEERREFRIPVATQLDLLRDVIPTNCQVRLFKTRRDMQISETTLEGRKGPIVVKKVVPVQNLVIEVETRGKDKVEVLQTRDRFLEDLRQAPRPKKWAVQVPAEGSSNTITRVDLVSSQTPDAARGAAMGIFEIRIPLALKEPSRDLP